MNENGSFDLFALIKWSFTVHVKKKQSTAFCSYGVRDFAIQTTLPPDNMH